MKAFNIASKPAAAVLAPLALALSMALGALPRPVAAQAGAAPAAEVPPFVPYAGDAGHQEIALGADVWYVAFHGTRKHAMPSVEAGWLARAGQLCQAAGRRHLVELRYVGEAVLEGDTLAAAADEPALFLQPAAGVVYIPIFTSSGPRTITPLLTPSKLGAVRCLATTTGLRPGKVALDAQQAVADARRAGLVIP